MMITMQHAMEDNEHVLCHCPVHHVARDTCTRALASLPPFRVGILCFPSECQAWSLLKVLLTHVSLSSLASSESHHNSSNPSHQHNRFNMHMNMNHYHNMYTTYAHDNTITRGHMIAIAVLFVIWCPWGYAHSMRYDMSIESTKLSQHLKNSKQ